MTLPAESTQIPVASLTIAGARFDLFGDVQPEELPGSFAPFLDSDLPYEAHRTVTFELGPVDDTVVNGPSNDPWVFRVLENARRLVRRNDTEGRTIWSLLDAPDEGWIRLMGEPELFPRYYESYEKAWETGMGLTCLNMALLNRGGLLLHGSASDLDGNGVLCVGVSGRGKSTISTLLDVAGARILTDEHPIVSGEGDAFLLHGGPWPSSAGYFAAASAPLRRIYFLEHGPENVIAPLAPGAAFKRLIDVTLIPWQDSKLFDPCLKTVEALLANVPAAVLSFKPDEEVIHVIRKDLAADRMII